MHDHFAFQHLVGESHWTERTRRRILQASRYSYPVLITGPAGTGKELLARAIHAHSPRADQPLIPFRCGRLPEALTSLQLFGHGAGAGRLTRNAAIGCVGAAERGTLLLHEVGELDLAAQDRLLQLLCDKSCRVIGADRSRPANVRIIATSSRDLGEAARAGRFRFPLLYTLNAIGIQALPLRERRADIGPLVRHVLARITFEHGLAPRALTPAAMALLEVYDWPGNVDELESTLEQAALGSESEVLDLEDFTDLFAAVQDQEAVGAVEDLRAESVNAYEAIPVLPVVAGQWPTLQQLEAEHLRATMRRSAHNVAVAARLLGLPDAELRSKLIQYGLRLPGRPTSLSDQPV